MILFKKSDHLIHYLSSYNKLKKNIGFVPTMGALHPGHLSLLEQSIANNQITVCSIFVNPVQFNDPEDYRKYPVTIENDILAVEQIGTDVIFMPDAKEIYPDGTSNLKHVDIGHLENILEGKFRPGHFQGVCQVMFRLLDIVKPGHLYMGQKDYQQCMVVNRLLEIMNDGVILHTCSTQREADGLAMSSRNVRLNEEERKKAVAIYTVLNYFKENLQTGDLNNLKKFGQQMLEQHGFKVDYVEIADAVSLKTVNNRDRKQKMVALIAAYMNDVRLIDNMILSG